ncbi:transporter substrate-binding domain-containing protein [Pseudomonas nitroreducens]|uniref:substrate-binding periplasmic protein n=1 Tax=Pseudomonas TaxID=286 RepID=UPI0019626021|nr:MULTISPECIES: transporter substrate-binding domain-containing protein [Pseudomonas]MDG9855182.1 transporter substrate-binding domain-containing protein [Pseudomonas nitroreducens]MDH1073977.1 transporter substrate-binding domain-containing protein [Pseudomonas nitroreducens]UCL89492.1 transporter substrate-binding domain-containing protein [Pseudomonas sp. HS-18]
MPSRAVRLPLLLRVRFKRLVLLGLALASLPLAACEKSLRWDDDPPFSMQLPDGRIGGLYVELNRAVLERLGCQVRMVKLPWARALKELELGRLDVLPGAFRKPEREVYAWFSGALLPPSRNILFVRRGLPQRDSLQQLSDLAGRDFRLGAQIDVSYGEPFRQLMADPDYAARVFFNPNRSNLWHMVDKGRIDGIIADEHSGQYELQQLGLAGRIEPTGVVVSAESAEVAFSKRTQDEGFVRRYVQMLKTLVEEGEDRRILQHYVSN